MHATSPWMSSEWHAGPKIFLPHVERITGKYLRLACFHVSNARQSKTFCDIVLVIDAYRLSPTLDPEDALHLRRPA